MKLYSDMDNRSRKNRIVFHVTDDELAIIHQKMNQASIINREAFIRKMIMEGKVLILEVPELRRVSSLLGHCSGNLNQIAKRINQSGHLYEGELSETKQILHTTEKGLRDVFEKLNAINT